MSDERNDDEILGRALSRAIETQDARETPYERSRLAVRPLPRGVVLWQLIGASAVTIVIALAFGAWFTRPTDTLPVAATSPTPTPTATHTPAATVETASAVPASGTPKTAVDHAVVYFARDGLPPLGLHVGGIATQATAAGRIDGRVTVIARNGDLTKFGTHDGVPPNAHNVFPTSSGIGVTSDASVNIQGDVATVDFDVPGGDWVVRGAAQSLALLQELVYTITEEPGINRVLITENGGKPTRIDQLAIDRPLSREDVFGYSSLGPVGVANVVSQSGASLALPRSGSGLTQVTLGTGMKVFEDVQVNDPKASPQTGLQVGPVPAFAAWLTPAQGDLQKMGKYVLTLVVGATSAPTAPTYQAVTINDQTPLRATLTAGGPDAAMWQYVLDDARPWRVYTDSSHGRVVVEIGGDPRMVSDRIALADSPSVRPGGTVGRTFTIAGAARTFEANVVWDVKDSSGAVVANGHTTASLGTSAVWGTFSAQATLPTAVSGNVTLRLYEVSPKDGSEQGIVSVPLVVR